MQFGVAQKRRRAEVSAYFNWQPDAGGGQCFNLKIHIGWCYWHRRRCHEQTAHYAMEDFYERIFDANRRPFICFGDIFCSRPTRTDR
jgi:hypothetical protein